MRWGWCAGVLAGVLAALWSGAGHAQELVHFPSLDAGATALDGYLMRPATPGRHSAIVFLHGCGGLLSRSTGKISPRETDWGARLTAAGYVVLMVDSFSPRQHGENCSQTGHDNALYLARPKDAYGALAYLQARDFVRPDRVGVMGWSEGGGVILFSIGATSLGRPSPLSGPDFHAAIAFYPASCNDKRQAANWTTTIPFLVLVGAADVWTPAAPCKALIDSAAGRSVPAQIVVYPGAYHDFDWPNIPVHELPAFRTRDGVVPITGTDPAARADAQQRVTDFLARYLN